MKVCISGAGVAGPTLAYWLLRAGHEPTLIEEAPQFRTGGYVIDFWGVGYDVAERMGLRQTINERGYRVDEVRALNCEGRKVSGFSAEIFRRLTNDRYISIARGTLAETIYETVEGKAETLFGQTIRSVEDKGDEVTVNLSGGASRNFDLLVGADGLHSNVRHLVWPDRKNAERHLGIYVAAFDVSGYPHRDEDIYMMRTAPGRTLARFTERNDRTLFLLIFTADKLGGPEPRSQGEVKAALRSVFDGLGWETDEVLSEMNTVDEVYFDRVGQIEIPEWSKGRTVLVGDAAACASLLAGEGTGLAMTESYILAGELQRHRGNVPAALVEYEAKLRPFLTAKQKSARGFTSFFVPSSPFSLWLRNMGMRMANIPGLAGPLLGGSARDDFDLPDYKY